MSNGFKREERYIVIKRSDLLEADKDGEVAPATFDAISALENVLPPRKFVVVESDWPEYETVWRMIEERTSGELNPETLTDKQIQKLWNEACKDTPQNPGWCRHIRFAKAVLRAASYTMPPKLEMPEVVAVVVAKGFGRACEATNEDALYLHCSVGEPLMTVAQHERILLQAKTTA